VYNIFILILAATTAADELQSDAADTSVIHRRNIADTSFQDLRIFEESSSRDATLVGTKRFAARSDPSPSARPRGNQSLDERLVIFDVDTFLSDIIFIVLFL